MNQSKYIAFVLLSVLAVVATIQASAQRSFDLPDIGDPTAATLPLSQEKRLGHIISRQLRSQLPIIEDVELNEYLTSLGKKLLSASTNNTLDFQFLLVDTPQINAFATPGGVIAINRGLVLVAESESELVGVLAHEIAHVTQRHLARLLSESKKLNWVGYLATISAVLAAAYNSQLAQLGTYAGIAVPIERTLNYSRTFEHEADWLGMQLMVEANYDPFGMPKFFNQLQSYGRGDTVPEFLRTHPLTAKRISDSLNRADLYKGNYRHSSTEFVYAKARLIALTDTRRALASKPVVETNVNANQYQRAVALTHTGKAAQAIRLLESIRTDRAVLAIDLALAEAYLAQSNHRSALALLKSLNEVHPGRESIMYQIGNALISAGKPAQALTRLRQFAQSQHTPSLDKLIAKAATQKGEIWLGHKHLANYHQANGRMQVALEQLALAEKDPRINQPAREAIKAERKRIEKLQLEMEKGLQ